jgi:hypothetical protein
MKIVALIFFLSILIGILFVGGLIWFILRKSKAPRQGKRNFAGGSHYHGDETHHEPVDFDDDSAAFYGGNSLLEHQQSEARFFEESARDSATQNDYSYSHESYDASGAGAEPSYSSYDSGSSYSSSDSGSSSSDSGSSSSSSD